MKKTFSSFLIAFTVITFNISSVRADNVIMPDGDIIDGKINYILGSTVEIKTKNGFKKINRNLNKNSARDIIEVGFFKRKELPAKLFILTIQKLCLSKIKNA